MKKLYFYSLLIFFFASCEVIIIEPAYDLRDDVVGSWEVEEYSETYNITTRYYINISKSVSEYDAVRIHNFYDVNVSVKAYVEGNKIYIPLQVKNGYEIEGVGTLHFGEITFNFSVYDLINGGITDYCDAIAW